MQNETDVYNVTVDEDFTAEWPEKKDKFIQELKYAEEDIKTCASKIFKKYDYDCSDKFFLISNGKSIDVGLKQVQSMLTAENKIIFCIYDIGKDIWVLSCFIFQSGGPVTILYKDPSGSNVPKAYSETFSKIFPDSIIITHQRDNIGRNSDAYYGPLCIRNLIILLALYKEQNQNDEVFVDLFPRISFSTVDKINQEKMGIALRIANEVSQNTQFVQWMSNYLDKSLPPYEEAAKEVNNFQKKVEDIYIELEKEEKKGSPDKGKIQKNLEKIESLRKALCESKVMKELQSSAKDSEEDDEKTDKNTKPETKYPEEMQKVGDMFKIIQNFEYNEESRGYLDTICAVLEITKKHMQLFCNFKINKKAVKKKAEEAEEPEEILHAPNYTCNKSVKKEEGARSLKELLKETIIGMDPEDDKPPEKSPMLDVIEQRFELVKTYYKKWEKKTSQEIFAWAEKIKGKLSKDNHEAICEAIAIADRVYYLTSEKGFRFRNTQILAMLIFLNEQDKRKGRLCQIRTGEGKTCIVAAVAAIRALQGFSVDIITSNMCLARDGVKSSYKFFSVFKLTVSTSEHKGNCYKKNILYATITDLQFDFLKYATDNRNIRKGRRFQQVILDEVDSMLVDNGGNIAKMSTPFPGMECLRYIYINIWMSLKKAEEMFSQEIQDKLKEVEDKYPKPEDRQKQYEKLLNELVETERSVLANRIKKSQPTTYPLIPKYLQNYVNRKLDIWIENAINARYYFHENEQYRIMDQNDESIIVPVDYENTGITLKNTIWSFGLHQFVQLKHCLRLTFESLTSSFISNIGFIKLYPNGLISGLTGTLGSRHEQKLLAKVYDVTYAKFPTFKKRQLEILKGKIAEDLEWADQVVQDIKNQKEKRAVLVINETIKDLELVKEKLIENGESSSIKVYKSEDEQAVTGEKLVVGDIVLATNIAGRGTDFKTDEKVEKGGGLHVIVGFLPCNQRVEEQACGRTARQGNKGTACLIIRKSEVEELGIENTDTEFDLVKTVRDRVEAKRLENIEEELIPELNFKDELFEYFSGFYRREKARHGDDERGDYYMSDLLESWAFWLDSKDFKGKNLKNKDAGKEFEAFAFSDTVQSITRGNISHNPIYNILIGKHYDTGFQESLKLYGRAIEMDSNTIIAASANLALFELFVDNAHIYLTRFIKAIGNLFFINLDPELDMKHYFEFFLKKAAAIYKSEMDYITNNFYDPMDEKNPRNHVFLETFKTQDRENFFLKHFFSRYYCLKIHYENSIAMIQEECPNIIFEGKRLTSMDFFNDFDREAPEKDKVKFSDLLTKYEISEFHEIGTSTLYAIRNLPDVKKEDFGGFRAQISLSFASLIPATLNPLLWPVCLAVAGALLTDAIMGIVLKILIPSNDQFSLKHYILHQFQTIGLALLTFGISVAVQSVTVLEKATEYCLKLSKWLRKCKHFKWICDKLAKVVDKIRLILEKRLAIAKLREVQAMQAINKFSSFNAFTDAFKTLAKETLIKIGKSITKELIVTAIFDQAVKIVKSEKAEAFKKDLNSNEKLKTLFIANNKETIIAKLEQYSKDLENTKAWVSKCESKLLTRLQEDKLIDDNDLKKIINAAIIAKKIRKCLEVFLEIDGTVPFKYLENTLPKKGGSCKLDVAIEEVATRTADIAVTHALELFKVGFSKLYSKLQH